MSTQKAHCETHKTYYHSCGTCHIAEIDRLTLAVAEARAEERKNLETLMKACKSAMLYFEMLERATGIEHGNLKELRAALAAYWAGKEKP